MGTQYLLNNTVILFLPYIAVDLLSVLIYICVFVISQISYLTWAFWFWGFLSVEYSSLPLHLQNHFPAPISPLLPSRWDLSPQHHAPPEPLPFLCDGMCVHSTLLQGRIRAPLSSLSPVFHSEGGREPTQKPRPKSLAQLQYSSPTPQFRVTCG